MLLKLKRSFIEKIYHSKNIYVNKLGVLVLYINQQKKLGVKIKASKNQKVNININTSIPELSWICEIRDNNYNFTIGSGVEYSNKIVFEGVWDGDFNRFDIKKSEFVFGSGAVIEENKITFITPKHILEGVFVLVDKKDKKTCVSNSLCFLLKKFNIDCEERFFEKLLKNLHNSINIASERGIDRYTQKVVESENYILYRMLFYNFNVDSLGNIKINLMLPKLYFSNFTQYKKFLTNKIKEITHNANATERKMKYPPITTVSKGYDSPTVSVLAKESGCRDALTLDVSIYGIDDSGIEIGTLLDYNVYSYKHIMAVYSEDNSSVNNLHVNFKDNLKKIAMEFIATGGVGDDVAFYPFKKKLINRLFLTGSFGDSVWNENSKIRPGLSCTTPFMKSITEFRLRTGFFFFPVPFLAARFPSEIIKISSSDELKMYSNGTDYNRPICRRIVEEAGIPRDEFGVFKNATAPLILNHNQLLKESLKEIMERY